MCLRETMYTIWSTCYNPLTLTGFLLYHETFKKKNGKRLRETLSLDHTHTQSFTQTISHTITALYTITQPHTHIAHCLQSLNVVHTEIKKMIPQVANTTK